MSGWRKRQIEDNKTVDEVLNEVLDIIGDSRNYNKSVYTSYDKGIADAMSQQLTSKITETFGLLKASEHMSDKGYRIGTEAEYQKFVEKRIGKSSSKN
jgi:hypothetical protein